MTAAEARSLTDARRVETHLDYLLRTKVYPRIQSAAEIGWDRATVSSCVGAPSGPYGMGEDIKDKVADVLRAQGYTVNTWVDMAGGPTVEVVW